MTTNDSNDEIIKKFNFPNEVECSNGVFVATEILLSEARADERSKMSKFVDSQELSEFERQIRADERAKLDTALAYNNPRWKHMKQQTAKQIFDELDRILMDSYPTKITGNSMRSYQALKKKFLGEGKGE